MTATSSGVAVFVSSGMDLGKTRLNDLSSKVIENLGSPIPRNWAFDQFVEEDFASSPSFSIDKDAYSGRDKGVSKFDKVTYKTPEELIADTQVQAASMMFTADILSVLNYMSDSVTVGLTEDSDD